MSSNLSTTLQDKKQQLSNNSTVNNNLIKLQYSNAELISLFRESFYDLTEEQYYPFYSKQVQQLGLQQFTKLANLARRSSDTPIRLFAWFLKNPELVRLT